MKSRLSSGEKDKVGNLIYEGDIIHGLSVPYGGVVKVIKGEFLVRITPLGGQNFYRKLSTEEKENEVVSNIYDFPKMASFVKEMDKEELILESKGIFVDGKYEQR